MLTSGNRGPVLGYFAKLTRRRFKRGVFKASSISRSLAAINRFIAETNQDPKSFVWTAKPDAILAAVKCGRETLESIR